MHDYIDVIIIGAGVVGLAIAAKLSAKKRNIFVLEKNNSFGQETSSRNSQVIHTGLYYLPGSLKAKTCVAGNNMLYSLCRNNSLAYKNITKIVVSTNLSEANELVNLQENAQKNGVTGLSLLSPSLIKKIEPNINALSALFVPSTGIIDVHGLMKYFYHQARNNGIEFVFKTEVSSIRKTNSGFELGLRDRECFSYFTTRVLINCAGLFADRIAQMAGIDINKSGYKLHFCKGDYFSVSGPVSKLVSRLVYPVPLPRVTGVGIHITLDLDGRMRLGPNVEYVNKIDYTVNTSNKHFFYRNVHKFLPSLTISDLEPEMAGIRPKLQGPGNSQKDFIIHHEVDKGLPGLINLIGIESPGLTASPAIAELVAEKVDLILS